MAAFWLQKIRGQNPKSNPSIVCFQTTLRILASGNSETTVLRQIPSPKNNVGRRDATVNLGMNREKNSE